MKIGEKIQITIERTDINRFSLTGPREGCGGPVDLCLDVIRSLINRDSEYVMVKKNDLERMLK